MRCAGRWQGTGVEILHEMGDGIFGVDGLAQIVEQWHAPAQHQTGVALVGEGPREAGIGALPSQTSPGGADPGGQV